jgi:hypothetical protein
MVNVTRVGDIGAEVATIELEDFSVDDLHSGIAEKLEKESTELRPSQQFELSREEIARDYRRLSTN